LLRILIERLCNYAVRKQNRSIVKFGFSPKLPNRPHFHSTSSHLRSKPNVSQ
jgi:hypothetical protein